MNRENFLKTEQIVKLFYQVDIPGIKDYNFLDGDIQVNPRHRTSEGVLIYVNDRYPIEAYTMWGGINCFDPIIEFFRSGGTFDFTQIFNKGRRTFPYYSLNGSVKKEESVFLEFDGFPRNTLFPPYVYCGRMKGCSHFIEEWKALTAWRRELC